MLKMTKLKVAILVCLAVVGVGVPTIYVAHSQQQAREATAKRVKREAQAKAVAVRQAEADRIEAEAEAKAEAPATTLEEAVETQSTLIGEGENQVRVICFNFAVFAMKPSTGTVLPVNRLAETIFKNAGKAVPSSASVLSAAAQAKLEADGLALCPK